MLLLQIEMLSRPIVFSSHEDFSCIVSSAIVRSILVHAVRAYGQLTTFTGRVATCVVTSASTTSGAHGLINTRCSRTEPYRLLLVLERALAL